MFDCLYQQVLNLMGNHLSFISVSSLKYTSHSFSFIVILKLLWEQTFCFQCMVFGAKYQGVTSATSSGTVQFPAVQNFELARKSLASHLYSFS